MYTIDFEDQAILSWDTGGTPHTDHDYHPTIYAHHRSHAPTEIQDYVADLDAVAETRVEKHRLDWRDTGTDVLAVDLTTMRAVDAVARHLRTQYPPGRIRLYNVDLTPQYRYCLETDRSPVPDADPTTVRIETTDKRIADNDITALTIDGTTHEGRETDILQTVHGTLTDQDPDILVLSHSDLVPLLTETARQHHMTDFKLGRRPGYTQLADESTYEQYGKIGHSPARYKVPGRAIIDLSNSFMLDETNLDGLEYLVERSWKPIQECSWASIGSILTAIQIRHAYDEDVLVPWRAWTPEQPKTLRTLHQADRGGFTFSPDVGVHEDVYACDFSSMYPWIIVTRNISPETVRCPCHDRNDVPELGYSICDHDGYLPNVLRPLLEDREDIKARLREAEDQAEIERLEGMSDAIKWILVSCFGYQGFSNAKWGVLRNHETINAYAREVLLTAKEVFEQHGWRVVHGIVDSIWLQQHEDDPEGIQELCDRITEETGIRLDFEAQYDWIAFCPKRETGGGALTRYFGKKNDGGFKVRGIELRQHSTPAFVKDVQQDLLETFDQHREPGPVCDRLAHHIHRLENGDIDPQDLLIQKRISKEPSEYTQSIKSAAAVKRARQLHDHHIGPGQSVEYLVHNDSSIGIERVRLPYDDPDTYDTAFYRDQLIRAAESILAPLGWERQEIRAAISETKDVGLRSFV
jgi:DNA polymerase I